VSPEKSRIVVLLCGSFAVVALNYRLVTTGHYRLPLFVFLAFVLAITFIFRKLPATNKSSDEIRRNLLKASSGFRRLGFIGAFGIAAYILTASRDDFKGFSTWGIVLLFLWGGFVVWCYFWAAKWYRRKADTPSVIAKHEGGK
jgi:hypothetical protein